MVGCWGLVWVVLVGGVVEVAEVVFGIQGGGAAGACGGDCLPVGVADQVPTLASSALGIGIPALIQAAYAARSRLLALVTVIRELADERHLVEMVVGQPHTGVGAAQQCPAARLERLGTSMSLRCVSPFAASPASRSPISGPAATARNRPSATSLCTFKPIRARCSPDLCLRLSRCFSLGHGYQRLSAALDVVDRGDDRLTARELEGSGRQLGQRLFVTLPC